MRLRCLGIVRPRAPPRLKEVVVLDVPEELTHGTIGEFCKLLADRSGSKPPTLYVPPGFAVPPGEPLSLLRADEEIWVHPAEALTFKALTDAPSPQGSKTRRRAVGPPLAEDPPAAAVKAPKRSPRSEASAPPIEDVAPGAGSRRVRQRVEPPLEPPVKIPAKPRVEPATEQAPSAGRSVADGPAPAGGKRIAELEALLASQAKRIADLESQNSDLRRQLRSSAPSSSGPPGNWSPVDAQMLKKGNVVTYSLDLIDAWGGRVQRSAAKVSVVTKVVQRQGVISYALRCERGGVDFVEASRLREVQLAI